MKGKLLIMCSLLYMILYSQGNAIEFDGSTIIEIPNSALINTSNLDEQSTGFWFYADDISGSNAQLIYDQGDTNSGFTIYIKDGTLHAYLYSFNALLFDHVSTTAITSQEWYHVCLVTNTSGTTSGVKLYLDGQLKQSVFYGSIISGHATDKVALGGVNSEARIFGASFTSEGQYFTGKLDDLRVFNGVLDDDQVVENMHSNEPGPTEDLVLYYDFDNTGAPVDESGLTPALNGTVKSGTATNTPSDKENSWVNTGTSSWDNAANWSDGIPNSSHKKILIQSGGVQPEISTSVSVPSILLDTGATLTVKNGGSFTSTQYSKLNENSSLILESGSDLTVDASSRLVVTSNATLNATGGDITVANTGKLVIEANGKLSASGDFTVNGAEAIVIESNASGTGNLAYTGNNLTYPNSGSITIQRYLTGNTDLNSASYHYISSPITNQAIFGDAVDLYAYKESTTTWIDPTDPTDGFAIFSPGQGYAMRYTANITKEFVGSVNTGSVSTPVFYADDPGNPYEHYNFFGNPYPSSISALSFFIPNSTYVQPSFSYWSGADFAVYNSLLSSGTAGSAGIAPDDNISIGQGFFAFMHNDVENASVTFTPSMQTTDSDNFYRKKAQDLVRLNVESSNNFNQIIVASHEEATADVEVYDSRKLSGNKALSLYSLCNENKLAIQTLPALNAETTVQLGIETNTADWFTFSKDALTDFDGDVYLWDSYKNHTVDLGKEDYKVFLEEGSYNNRFKMVFALREGVPVNSIDVSAYVNGTNIQLDLSQEVVVTSMRMYGINGQLVKAWTNENNYDVSDVHNGAYLLQIETKEGITKSTRVVLAK